MSSGRAMVPVETKKSSGILDSLRLSESFLPLIAKQYRTKTKNADMCFGGTSKGLANRLVRGGGRLLFPLAVG